MTTTTTPTSRTRPLLIAASVPSALSLAWTAWSVADMIPAPMPIAIAAGVALDVGLIGAVAIAWISPAIARPASIIAWAIASVAAIAVGVHSWSITPALALLAVVPLISKGLWQLALGAKRAQEAAQAEEEAQDARERAEADRKAARLSTGLTEDQEAELAELERETVYVTAKTAKELALDDARAYADQQRALAEIRRQAEQQMAVDEGAADIEVQRLKLRNKIRLAAPVYTVTELPAGGQHEQVPDDPSGFGIPPVAGFGFPQTPAGGAHPADQQVPRVPTPCDTGLSEGERNRRLVLDAYRRLSAGGTVPSVSAVADAAGVSRRTVNRHLPPEMKSQHS